MRKKKEKIMKKKLNYISKYMCHTAGIEGRGLLRIHTPPRSHGTVVEN